MAFIEAPGVYYGYFSLLYTLHYSAFSEGEHSSIEIKELIDHHLQAKADIESALPQYLVIGAFYINVDSVRMAIANKHKDMAKSLLQYLALKLRKDADKVTELCLLS